MKTEKCISQKEIVDFLNELLSIDSVTINKLFSGRIACNLALTSHPHVQVAMENGEYKVGLLGILNGVFLEHCDENTPKIAMEVNEEDMSIIKRFVVREN